MRLEAGVLVGDRFRLIARRAEGALGELWRASDRTPRELVSVRVLAAPDDGALETALRDARAAATVRHPAVARIVAVAPRADRHGAWIASEWLHLDRLDALLARRGALLPGAALELIATLAEGLAAAHARGAAHGAIEPRAVALCRGSDARISAKLLDLGLGALRARTRAQEASYRAPELASWEPSTTAGDVFAMGQLLRACLDESAIEPRVRALIERCRAADPRARLDAASLAAEARFTARRARGGFLDLSRRARFPEQAAPSPDPRMSHWPTLPGLGAHGSPEPRASEPGPRWLGAVRALLAPPSKDAPASSPPGSSLSPLAASADRLSRGRGRRSSASALRAVDVMDRPLAATTAGTDAEDDEPSGCSFPSPAPIGLETEKSADPTGERTTAEALSALRASRRIRAPHALAAAAALALLVIGAAARTPGRRSAATATSPIARSSEEGRPRASPVIAAAPALRVAPPSSSSASVETPDARSPSVASQPPIVAGPTRAQPTPSAPRRAASTPARPTSTSTSTSTTTTIAPAPTSTAVSADAMARIGNVTGVPLLDGRAPPPSAPKKVDDAPYE